MGLANVHCGATPPSVMVLFAFSLTFLNSVHLQFVTLTLLNFSILTFHFCFFTFHHQFRCCHLHSFHFHFSATFVPSRLCPLISSLTRIVDEHPEYSNDSYVVDNLLVLHIYFRFHLFLSNLINLILTFSFISTSGFFFFSPFLSI